MCWRFLIVPAFSLLMALLVCSLSAEEILKERVASKEVCDRAVCDDMCELIKNDLRRGVDAKTVTKTNILVGNNFCLVVKCVIDGGGRLDLLIAGAVEAGSTPDVISRCCISAGAKPGSVAQALLSVGEPVSSTAVGDNSSAVQLVPSDAVPPGDPQGGTISPSSF